MTFMDNIEISKDYVTRTLLFNQIKTGDPIIDAFLTTFVLSVFSWLVSWVYNNHINNVVFYFSLDDIKSIFYKKNTIIIEGRKSLIISYLSNNISAAYSDRFKAMWNYIIKNIENNKSIYKIKENHTNFQTSNDYKNQKKNLDMFMVYQNKHFVIDDGVYANAHIEQETEKNDNNKTNVKTDKIILNIYSYKLSIPELLQYIDNITEKYLLSIKDKRGNKRFIYSLDKVEIKEDDESKYALWREDEFESARTFQNIFFDGKYELINRIDFFLNNKKWYYEKGIPYSLGIGLHGPPGTGKTSFIKALANYTNRHIIVLSLKMIKTKNQLESLFFENTYNENNENNAISWDKKIIVFEDIDCIGDIILNREEKYKERNNRKAKNILHNQSVHNTDNAIKVGNILQTICDMNDNNSSTSCLLKDSLITLDDILNLWDGIRETPGRILIISSNHYNKLDPALIRPGRIDITHELSNASHKTISEIYTHLFNSKIDAKKLNKVKEFFYSPAELINIYVGNKNEESFMNRLLENKKL